jgi:hypothetical protein
MLNFTPFKKIKNQNGCFYYIFFYKVLYYYVLDNLFKLLKNLKGDGKASATKEDRAELLKHLYDWSIGKNAEVFYKFFGHLSEHGKKDGFPFLDKDLLFCVDAIRLKVSFLM